MLLAFLHKLKRLLPLLWSKHGIDLRPHAFLFHNQVSHKLGLFVGEGAGLVLVKASVYVCIFRLLILAELLHHRLDLGFFISHDALNLGLLGLSQVQLLGHVFQHPTIVAAKAHATMLPKSGCRQACCQGHKDGGENDRFLMHYMLLFWQLHPPGTAPGNPPMATTSVNPAWRE